MGCSEIYCGNEHAINILRYPEFDFITSLKGHTGLIRSFSLLKNLLFSASDDKHIKL